MGVRVPTGICIIAHAPLASALKTCAQHIFSTTQDRCAERILAYDVPSGVKVDEGIEHARRLVRELLARGDGVIVFTDLTGATPANIACALLEEPLVRVISGTNLPAIIAALGAPADAPVSQIAFLAEAAARASLGSISKHPD